MRARLCSFALFLAMLCVPGFAFAICGLPPHYLYVGNDAQCGFGDIQSAINAVVCPETTIVITSELTYSGEHLDISGKSLNLVGSANACGIPTPYCDPATGCGNGGPPPAPPVTLRGDGEDSVIYIHGNSDVAVQSLTLTGGGGVDYGGGIHYTGFGNLSIIDSTITENSANVAGGGVQFNGSGGAATMELDAGTLIDENTSLGAGGGIQINGTARLFVLEPYTLVGYNHAPLGNGGGIEIVGPARADIGSPGYNGAAVVEFNDAEYGGGLSLDGDSNIDAGAVARLFTTDGQHPVQVSDNTASHTGGGVYLHPNADSGGQNAELCAFDFRFEDNIAQEGTAIYADLDTNGGDPYGSQIYLNGSDPCGPESPPSLGAVACADGVPCNTISDNVAENDSNQPTPGSAVLVQDDGVFAADRLEMRGNSGAHAIRVFDSELSVGNCLIADNAFTSYVVRYQNDNTGYGPAQILVDACTIAGNLVASDVIHSETGLVLTNDIVDEPGTPTLDYAANPAELVVAYVLATDTSTLPVGTGVIQGEPTFVDAGAGDYHLQRTSLGVDYAPGASGTDLDRKPRTVDLPDVPNEYGPMDLGAYEIQLACAQADTIFCDGFETIP